MPTPGAERSLYCGSRFEKSGTLPFCRQRADADHVRQRGRVARVGPRRRERLVRVADRRDDHGALRVRVRDGARLDRGVRVAVLVLRIARPAEAEVDHLRAVVRGPADRGRLGLDRDVSARLDDLRDDQLRGVRHADGPGRVHVRDDLSGDEGAVAVGVRRRAAADEAARVGDPAGEVGERRIDAGVDDRHLHRCERRRRGRPGVERVVGGEIPLLRRERICRREGSGRRRGDECHGDGDEGEPFHQPVTVNATEVPGE